MTDEEARDARRLLAAMTMVYARDRGMEPERVVQDPAERERFVEQVRAFHRAEEFAGEEQAMLGRVVEVMEVMEEAHAQWVEREAGQTSGGEPPDTQQPS